MFFWYRNMSTKQNFKNIFCGSFEDMIENYCSIDVLKVLYEVRSVYDDYLKSENCSTTYTLLSSMIYLMTTFTFE